MPSPLRHTANVRQMPTPLIVRQINTVLPKWKHTAWTPRRQQYLFSRALEIYRRPDANNVQKNRALTILRVLAMEYNRNWNNLPKPAHIFMGSNNNNNN